MNNKEVEIEIDNLNSIRVNGKEIINLCCDNIYPPLDQLNKYLDFIKTLTFRSYRNNKYINKKEYEMLIYNTFLFFLINWDNLFHTKQIPFYIWYNFKKTIDNLLKTKKEKLKFILDQNYVNTEYFKKYIKKISKNVKVINKNHILDYIIDKLQGNLIMIYFLLRKIISHTYSQKNTFYILFITDYDRYYKNSRFFGEHLFKDTKFNNFLKKITRVAVEYNNYRILYTRYNYTKIRKYIKDIKNRRKDTLFIEDILNLELGINILLDSKKIYKKPKILPKDEHEEFILYMFNEFLKHKLPFIIWFYLSINEFINNNKIRVIIGDSEKNFMFYLFNTLRLINSNFKTIAFSHEIINRNYIYIPISEKFKNIPDYKLVWNNKIKKLLIKKYNFHKKNLKIFADPRFLYWKKFLLKKKTILFVSQGHPNFYREIFNIFKEKKFIDNLIKKGLSFYFKLHPGEYNLAITKNYLNKLKTIKEIKIINELDFIPEYTIGMSSTMIYELLNAGSKSYFLDSRVKEAFMMDEKEFKKYFRKKLKEVLSEILMECY